MNYEIPKDKCTDCGKMEKPLVQKGASKDDKIKPEESICIKCCGKRGIYL